MLPEFFDLSHMRIIFVILGVISLLVMFMVIKHVEKPMLRVTVVGFLLIFVYVSYISFNRLGECQKMELNARFLT